MRYYKVVVTDPKTGMIVVPNYSIGAMPTPPFGRSPANSGATTFCSELNGAPNPNALLIELDIPVIAFMESMGNAQITIWGIGLPQIAQASSLNGFDISVYGGMSKGLPLANPNQQGLLVKGTIFQCFGNWIGTSQTLSFVFNPLTGDANSPLNFSFDWKAGMLMKDAISSTLSTAFPTLKQSISISNNLVLSSDQPGIYQSLNQFSSFVFGISRAILGDSYGGVRMTVRGDTIFVYDGSTAASPKQIAFVDLIGQPTWTNFATVQIFCVMRADIQLGDFIKMPPANVVVTSGSNPQARSASAFQGVFQVIRVRHVGNSRQRDAGSWVTVIDATTPSSVAPSVQ
jgi:hypothetical protein